MLWVTALNTANVHSRNQEAHFPGIIHWRTRSPFIHCLQSQMCWVSEECIHLPFQVGPNQSSARPHGTGESPKIKMERQRKGFCFSGILSFILKNGFFLIFVMHMCMFCLVSGFLSSVPCVWSHPECIMKERFTGCIAIWCFIVCTSYNLFIHFSDVEIWVISKYWQVWINLLRMFYIWVHLCLHFC